MEVSSSKTVLIELTGLTADQALAIKEALGASNNETYSSEEVNTAADQVHDMLFDKLNGLLDRFPDD